MGTRLLNGLLGALLGAGIAWSVYWWLDGMNGIVIAAAGGVGFLLGLFGGKSAIHVLRELLDAS